MCQGDATRDLARCAMRQAEKRELTRRNVLNAAHRVFGRSGYHGATLQEIAVAAGVSKGAVYYNFASKEELFLALLDARMEERLQEIRAAYATPDLEPDPSGRAARDYMDNLQRNREWIPLFFEFVAHAARDERFRKEFAARFKRFWDELGAVVESRARKENLALPLPATHLAIALDVLGIGFMLPQIVDPDHVPDDLLPKALGYMLRGVTDAAREQAAPPT
jgi:AcrR family transcriptional regulator